MSLKGLRGAWINQFAQPNSSVFTQRANRVDYVVVKYGLAFYEGLARSIAKPWVAERMAEDGAGDQNAPSRAPKYGRQLGEQANQPGCIAAIINLEEADGGWHNDNGTGTRALIDAYHSICSKPLYASLDTRGARPDSAYQQVCAQFCQGVMPMLYPAAFQQSVPKSIEAVLTNLVDQRWAGKEIIPTIQTYGTIGAPEVQTLSNLLGVLFAGQKVAGINAYTLGHASQQQWDAFINNSGWVNAPAPVMPQPGVSMSEALLALRVRWLEQWTQIALRGNVGEAEALANYWKMLVS